jgi:uncharacterized membrane protein
MNVDAVLLFVHLTRMLTLLFAVLFYILYSLRVYLIYFVIIALPYPPSSVIH